MARTRTVADLISEIRSRGEVRSSYAADAEVLFYLNTGVAKLYRLIVGVNKDLYLSSHNLTVVSGTDAYALAADYWRTVGVEVQDGSYWYPLKRFLYAERLQYQQTSNRRTTRYRVMGGNVRLSPTPAWAGTVRHWYIPAPPTLAAGGSWDGFAGWEEFAIVDAVVGLKLKQEEDASGEMTQLQALTAEIKASSRERDDAEPDRVRDVENEVVDRDYWVRGGG